MPEKWTADIVGKMHLHGIKAKELAEEVGWNAKYLSSVLNGHEVSGVAEKKLNDALDRILEKKEK